MTDYNGKIPEMDAEKTLRNISNFIEYSLIESNARGLVMGLSGGLDSSTVARISTEVVNDEKILGLVMPTNTTPESDVGDAINLAQELGINYKVIDIEPLLGPVENICQDDIDKEHVKIANANLKARMRMMILYYHANALNRLVVGTGNRTELLVGYFTKYGDGGADILPIGGLYKTDVRALARYLKLPSQIIEKAPTAGLWHGQTDEEDLGIKYEVLDEILYLMTEKNLKEDEIARELKVASREVVKVKVMMHAAQHKLETPPIAEIQR
ncbi:MAG TPA: NAD+ synthase [Methanobacteriaceae archaeon]|nr:NAD+ synthase [Methanobacteriaceae archaeon]